MQLSRCQRYPTAPTLIVSGPQNVTSRWQIDHLTPSQLAFTTEWNIYPTLRLALKVHLKLMQATAVIHSQHETALRARDFGRLKTCRRRRNKFGFELISRSLALDNFDWFHC